MKFFPIFSTILLCLIFVIFLFHFFHEKPHFRASVINKDIIKIVSAMNKIDKECSILKIKNRTNKIDFLNVVKFSGSEVGPLSLAYPKNWRGPYLFDNPTYQGKPYQIVKTNEGVFVIPGDGVVLPNKFEIGKDFKISFKSPISKMMEKGGVLSYRGMALGAELKFTIGDWGEEKLGTDKIEKISEVLEEFNEAMPFTHNQTVPYTC